MPQIFISAGHGGYEDGVLDPGAVLPETTEAAEMIQVRDLVVAELRSRGLSVLSVPDDLSAAQTIAWINARCRPQDVALEIHAGAHSDTSVRGTTAFYIARNDTRRTHAELVLLALLRRVPELRSRGVKPDTDSPTGSMAFLRNVTCPSLLMELGYLTNPQDLNLIQNRRRDLALGLADGLASWSRAVNSSQAPELPPGTYPEIGIKVNGAAYQETGILVNSNSYVPIDLADVLGVSLETANVTRIRYANVVYIKAIDLRNYGISVGWDASTRTVLLRSRLGGQVCPGTLDRLIANGATSEVQLLMFLKSVNESAVNQYRDLPKLYREEAAIEGVNHDVAFCQMLVETNALSFGGSLKPSQNNFGGVGSPTGGMEGASFPSARVGVRAQIQHLKAYGGLEPLVQRQVDPRFQFVRRGIAPLVQQLSGRWSNDMEYGSKILAFMRRLYESAGLL
ncbi:N-acetylmuramoyl-L-alanine amidase [Nodosilinea sp. P-1105]|uniref:hormogonium tapered terminus morphoprotein TftA n=1 Tax=Nodosilinea sp. P-1105 TaxID=2546229 RepID=UPI00146C8B31|nr:N-acetylmuramoyl-L-alanine amidase [Nodosilinea sp. P-1105]NMF82605.1 cell wall hydrolase [Nodosilinea sp. P-1105]